MENRVIIYVLGISAFYHDSAAALLGDGEILAAAQEERFTRIKHDAAFPTHAVAYCLESAGIGPEDLDAVVFYDKPLLKFERILESYLATAPLGLRSFMMALPLWVREKLFLPREIDAGLKNQYTGPIYFTEHHESHGASAFFPSPFEEAAVITLDGVGEWSTTSWGVGRGNHLRLEKEIHFPHSLGLLYSAFTYYTGFRVNSGEYKLMGLAPYGEPRYADLIREHLIEIHDDGSFWLDQRYFNYCSGLTMTSKRFHTLFGGEPRKPESPITQREMDLARSIQVVLEEVVLRIAAHVHQETGLDNLCLAGGVALNCVANGELLRKGPFKHIWIQPAAGDAGGAVGAALFGWHQILGHARCVTATDRQQGSYLGPSFSDEEIQEHLDRMGARYIHFASEAELLATVATHLEAGQIVGHFAGRMEFGPRALGGRSILGDPRNPALQSTMNRKIKFRESFRPFAPSCLEERAAEYFDLEGESPYMLLVAPVTEARRLPPGNRGLFGIDLVNEARSDIPAVTHVDYSARIQTVNEQQSPRYYRLIKAFETRTGCPMVINTSFNIRGEPIVGTPEEAYRCFMFSDMDVLVLENCLCIKSEQAPMEGADAYKKQFKLD